MTTAKRTPDVSTVIATHDRLWALPEAIESCRHDSCVTEIVVVDDGSTDGTWEWLQVQPDIVKIRSDHNGKCWAANIGVAAATGEFIRFLDSDDWLLPGSTDRQLAVARETDADLVIAGHISYFEDTGAKVEVPCRISDDFLGGYIDQVRTASEFSYCACLIRRSLLQPIPHRPEYPWHDIMLVMEIALADPKVIGCEFPSLVVRKHSRDDRLSVFHDFEQGIEAMGAVAMYKKIYSALDLRGECSGARKDALLKALWGQARLIAAWHMREATELARWIRLQDDGFRPPVKRPIDRSYRLIGFSMTERLVGLQRASKIWARS